MANTEDETSRPQRLVGLMLALTGIASLALLALHPVPSARDFAGLLRDEASERVRDAIVHGGFIVVLALQIIAYAIFSIRIGLGRPAALAGIIFFGIGVMFFSGALVLDGLAAPAIATRYVTTPQKIEFARTLYILMGTLVSVLQPLGMVFQAAAIIAWGSMLVGNRKRLAGLFAIVLGLAVGAATGASLALMNPLPLMVAIVGTTLWAVVVGVGMVRGRF